MGGWPHPGTAPCLGLGGGPSLAYVLGSPAQGSLAPLGPGGTRQLPPSRGELFSPC